MVPPGWNSAHGVRGMWAPTLDQARRTQVHLCRIVVRVVLAVPTADPIELTGDSGTAPELLALPISAGGFAMPLCVERQFLRQGGQHHSRLGPAFYLPALEGWLAAATATCPRVVHAAWAWHGSPDGKSQYGSRACRIDRVYTPPAAAIRDAAEHAGSGSITRAVSLVARCFSLHGISAVFYEDRRPALLLYNGTKTSKAAVLWRATATANAAMATFMAVVRAAAAARAAVAVAVDVVAAAAATAVAVRAVAAATVPVAAAPPLPLRALGRRCRRYKSKLRQGRVRIKGECARVLPPPPTSRSPGPPSSRPTSLGSPPLRASAFFLSTHTASPKPTPTSIASAHTPTS